MLLGIVDRLLPVDTATEQRLSADTRRVLNKVGGIGKPFLGSEWAHDPVTLQERIRIDRGDIRFRRGRSVRTYNVSPEDAQAGMTLRVTNELDDPRAINRINRVERIVRRTRRTGAAIVAVLGVATASIYVGEQISETLGQPTVATDTNTNTMAAGGEQPDVVPIPVPTNLSALGQ